MRKDNTIMRKVFRQMRDLRMYSPVLIALSWVAAPAFAEDNPSHEQQLARAALEKHRWEFSEDRFVTLSSTAKRDVIELYLKAGMSPNAKDARGRPAVVAVLANGRLFSSNALGSMGHALLKERLDVLQYFLSSGADPNLGDKSGITALHEAAMYSAFAPAIKPLVRAGAKVDAPEMKYNFSPLHMAALANNAEGVRELLAAGASADSLAKQSVTPLMLALNAGNDSIVDLLLQAGADPLRKTDGGKSCLHFAAEGASASAIQRLLAKGAVLTAVDGSQKTPLQLTQEKNRDPAILSLLRP
jgi:ankyrin repeat protein